MQVQDARARNMRGSTTVRQFQIRGRFFTGLTLRLERPPDGQLIAALDAELMQTPQFFADTPMVIDFEHTRGRVHLEDFQRLVDHLRLRKVQVFGVQNASPEQLAKAATLGLIPLMGGRDAPPRGRPQEPEPVVSAQEPHKRAARLITAPIRSGQTIFAEEGDLTVVGPVGSGAELIAAGSIHVYGQMRGRALAGVHGDETARIFCQSLDAELLAINGVYITSETFEPSVRKQNVQVFLQGDTLCIEALGQPQNRDRSSS